MQGFIVCGWLTTTVMGSGTWEMTTPHPTDTHPINLLSHPNPSPRDWCNNNHSTIYIVYLHSTLSQQCDNHYDMHVTPTMTSMWQPLWHPCDNHYGIHMTTTMTSTWQPLWHPYDNHYDIHVTTTMASMWHPLGHPVPLGTGKGYTGG